MRLWLIVEWCSRSPTMSMLDRRSWRPRDGTRTMGTWDQVIVNGPHSTGAWYLSTKIMCMCLVHSHKQRSLAFPRSFVEQMVACCIRIWSNEKTMNDNKIKPPGRRFASRKSCLTSTNLCIQIRLNKKTTNDDRIKPPGRRFESRKLCLTSINLSLLFCFEKRLC